jgi:hypothetical protein
MKLLTQCIVFPEGDTQEISWRLRINQIVDLNGKPLQPPLRTVRMIVYRVFRISTTESRNEDMTHYHLELVNVDELVEYLSP